MANFWAIVLVAILGISRATGQPLTVSELAFGTTNGPAAVYTFYGQVWTNETISSNVVLANIPTNPPVLTFTCSNASPILQRFYFYASKSVPYNNYTIGDFVTNQSTFELGVGWTNNCPGQILTGSTFSTNSITSVVVLINGYISVTNGETFTYHHDDGMTLLIAGSTYVNEPFTGVYSGTFNYVGLTGIQTLTIFYGNSVPNDADLTLSF